MAEEGVVQIFTPVDGTQPIVGVIGALQLDVLAERLKNEYGLPIAFEQAPCEVARWMCADDPKVLEAFIDKNRSKIAEDQDGDNVYLAESRVLAALGGGQEPRHQIHGREDDKDGVRRVVRSVSRGHPVTAPGSSFRS